MEDWAWLDNVVGPLDEDFIEAASARPSGQAVAGFPNKTLEGLYPTVSRNVEDWES